MNVTILSVIAVVAAFAIGMLISPGYIKLAGGGRAEQTILSYVEQHRGKKGVPTMAGSVFIAAAVIAGLVCGGYKSNLAIVFLLILFSYGVIGFLDDFIKVKLARNLGLKAYQKILSQLAVALIAAFYCYKNRYIGSVISVPGTDIAWEMGVFYIPFAVIAFIALSNSVNLTDGLDGLAGTVNAVYFSTFLIIIILGVFDAYDSGDVLYAEELKGLAVTVASLIGGLLAFLWYNGHKARYFMGDTGSLALGGAAAAVALFVKNPLIAILIGIVFVISAISVIIQVISFKSRKKRVFLMAPYHHHLELKGYNESKIVGFYGIITAIAAAIGIALTV